MNTQTAACAALCVALCGCLRQGDDLSPGEAQEVSAGALIADQINEGQRLDEGLNMSADTGGEVSLDAGLDARLELDLDAELDAELDQEMNHECVTSSLDDDCDGQDNDCDGVIDEGFVSQLISCGLGACAREARSQCTASGLVDDCSPLQPSADNDEVCDGLDEDCDGLIDEDCLSLCDGVTRGCSELSFVRVSEGSFTMGTSGGDPDESPAHTVIINAFEITETEVTVAQYRACVEAGVCSEPNIGGACNWGVEGREAHPVNCVDWAQARTFAKWIGPEVELPTEAEWEYAARGGEGYRYAGSDDLNEVGWYLNNSGDSTRPVGVKLSNGYGLFDMSGNVWEWVLDEYHSSYQGAPAVGDQPWGDVPDCSPLCELGVATRASRGGSWNREASSLRVTNRVDYAPNFRAARVGFRVRRAVAP